MSIYDNILSIKERMKSACERSGRRLEEVTLVAVTKTVDVERIKEAVESGISNLGENKVQEIVDKFPRLQGNINWHLIGHLQTNKVKYIVDKVSMIHSVDSLRLAEEINKRFENSGRNINILVEINISGESNKYGIDQGQVSEFLKSINKYKSINICGLMTVGPALDDPDDIRPYFKRMKEIFERVKSEGIENVNMKFLSMGMTNDFEVAIEEGANIIRVGSGLFGPRNYNV